MLLFCVPLQFTYGSVETDDDNASEMDRNASSISRTRVLLHPIPPKHGMRSTGLSFPSMSTLDGRLVELRQI